MTANLTPDFLSKDFCLDPGLEWNFFLMRMAQFPPSKSNDIAFMKSSQVRVLRWWQVNPFPQTRFGGVVRRGTTMPAPDIDSQSPDISGVNGGLFSSMHPDLAFLGVLSFLDLFSQRRLSPWCFAWPHILCGRKVPLDKGALCVWHRQGPEVSPQITQH